MELQGKYVLGSIKIVSYALAVDISCPDRHFPDPENKPERCLIADPNMALREFQGYPLAFYPAHGNFSPPQPPVLLVNNLAVTQNSAGEHKLPAQSVGVLSHRHF